MDNPLVGQRYVTKQQLTEHTPAPICGSHAPFASAEPLDAIQMDTTAEPLESEGDYIRRCYQQVTTILGIDMIKFLCLRGAQLVTDSIIEVALERQLNPKWVDKHAPYQ